MEPLQDFYDLENQRETTEDIENSIHNSLIDNRRTNRYNCYELVFNDCFWVDFFLLLGIILLMIIVVTIITVILVKKLD